MHMKLVYLFTLVTYTVTGQVERKKIKIIKPFALRKISCSLLPKYPY